MKLYVGTYRKYNSGSLKGAWLNLDDYRDGNEFLKACKRLHRGERDPEFMFQDVETDPGEDWQEGLYSECSIPWDYWKLKAEAQAAKANEPKPAKTEKAEQARLCERYTEIREGFKRAERPERFDKEYKYYLSSYYFVELSDGVILDIGKPSIQTRFCCGEDDRGQGGEAYGTMAFAHKYLNHKKTREGFMSANLERFDGRMVAQFGRKAWRRAKQWAAGKIPVDHGCSWRYDFVPCLMRGAYANTKTIYLGNACDKGRWEIVRWLTDEEMLKMRKAYMGVRKAFVKRLDAWYKRFGADKIHTWTYWTEA